jgi:hypothetical protein
MKSYLTFVSLCLALLAGCNTPTPSSELIVPRFSSAPYKDLSCSELAIERKKMDKSVQELSVMQDNGKMVMHADIPFIGTGDTMATIELVKLKARLDAIKRVYDSKECSL